MEKKLLQEYTVPRRINLKIEQPEIICEGRERISCNYRGTVVSEVEDSMLIEFKAKGELQTVLYVKKQNKFVGEQWQDLKIIN